MLGVKPDKKMWARVNKVIMGENAAVVLVTFQSAMCQLLIQNGVAQTEDQARAHLAAMLVSPDRDPMPGSLVGLMQAELLRLSDGKWLQ